MANEERYDEQLDLVLTRTIDVPRALVWEAWTNPEHVKKWFAPAPWTTVDCEIELRPGGIFRTVMRSPEGRDFPNVACFLELVEHRKIVWTDALAPGYRPATPGGSSSSCVPFFFTAIITLEDHSGRTKCTARVLHKDDHDRKTHEEMGFFDGWGQCLEQLVAVVKKL